MGFQGAAQFARQRAAAGLVQAADARAADVQAVARAHRRDDGDAARLCGGYQRGFAGDGVDAVGEHVRRISRKPFARVAGVDEAVTDGERELGVDVQQALAHDFGFFAAEGAVKRQQLAVEVGWRDGVVVEDNHLADAGAGDGFGAVAADTAEAGDENGFVAQAVEAVVADEDLAAGVGCGHVRVTS